MVKFVLYADRNSSGDPVIDNAIPFIKKIVKTPTFEIQNSGLIGPPVAPNLGYFCARKITNISPKISQLVRKNLSISVLFLLSNFAASTLVIVVWLLLLLVILILLTLLLFSVSIKLLAFKPLLT